MKNYIRIKDKRQARKLHEQGIQLYFLPSKVNEQSIWWNPPIPFPNDRSFEKTYNECVYYNCNTETGKTLKFYKEEM